MASPAASNPFATLIGEIYSRWTLDCLIEIAHAIAVDFVNRPQMYLGRDIPSSIANFRISYGALAAFPNTAQRQAMMMPVFGRSDGLKPDSSNATSAFQMARKKLVDACIAFSERAVDTGIPMLEDRVRSALVPLTAHLNGLEGKSVELTGEELLATFSTVFQILLSAAVAQVFGLPKVDGQWPLQSTDPNGAKLVEAAGITLALPADYKLSYTKFILLQRVAQEGAKALPLVLTTDPSSEPQLLALITQVYTWGTSLRDFQQAA